MSLSQHTSESLRFEIEQDIPKDNIANSILKCIDRHSENKDSERESVKVERQENLLKTMEYNIKLDTGKEINLKEIKNEEDRIKLKSTDISYDDKLREAAKISRDLLDIKDKDERRQLILNSTPRELNSMMNIPKDCNSPLKTEMQSLIDSSKYDEYDKRGVENIASYAIRSMSISEVRELFDCKDVFCLGRYDKACMFPASQIYNDRSGELFGSDGDKLTIKFEIKSPEIYNYLSVGEYYVAKYDKDESFKSGLRQDPCLDIVKEDKKMEVTVLSPEYHLPSYNIAQLLPVEINGRDISDMKVSDIVNYIKDIPFDTEDYGIEIDKDIDKGILGTGEVLKDMAQKLEPRGRG